MKKFLCWLFWHRLYDTGNRIGVYPVMRCRRCGRAWFNREELLPPRYDRPQDNPWNR